MPTDAAHAASDAPTGASRPVLDVEIYSDVVCPWCYIGKRRFERAADELRDEVDLRVRYRPFQLDPRAPVGSPTPVREAYERKFGGPRQADALIGRVTAMAAQEGLDFRMDQALRANTRLAHQLLAWAESPDAGVDHAELKERLLQAYFVDGLDVGDLDTLVELAVELGADPARVRAFLADDGGADQLHADLGRADDLGITAVPTFVFAGRWQVPGAQEPETLVQVIRRAVERLTPAETTVPVVDTADGEVCTVDGEADC